MITSTYAIIYLCWRSLIRSVRWYRPLIHTSIWTILVLVKQKHKQKPSQVWMAQTNQQQWLNLKGVFSAKFGGDSNVWHKTCKYTVYIYIHIYICLKILIPDLKREPICCSLLIWQQLLKCLKCKLSWIFQQLGSHIGKMVASAEISRDRRLRLEEQTNNKAAGQCIYIPTKGLLSHVLVMTLHLHHIWGFGGPDLRDVGGVINCTF